MCSYYINSYEFKGRKWLSVLRMSASLVFKGIVLMGIWLTGEEGAFGAGHDVTMSRCNPLALESYQQRRTSARGREEALISPEGINATKTQTRLLNTAAEVDYDLNLDTISVFQRETKDVTSLLIAGCRRDTAAAQKMLDGENGASCLRGL